MSEPERLAVSANGVRLNLYHLGPAPSEAAPPVVMLHGMRDVGLSLLPIAEAVAETHPVFLMDLRGHGDSQRRGSSEQREHGRPSGGPPSQGSYQLAAARLGAALRLAQ